MIRSPQSGPRLLLQTGDVLAAVCLALLSLAGCRQLPQTRYAAAESLLIAGAAEIDADVSGGKRRASQDDTVAVRAQTPAREPRSPRSLWGHAPRTIFGEVDAALDIPQGLPRFDLGITPAPSEARDLPAPSAGAPALSLVEYQALDSWPMPDCGSPVEPAAQGPFATSAEAPWDCEVCPAGFTLREDWDSLLPTLWDDACSMIRWENAIILGAAAGAAIALRDNVDGEVRAYTAERPLRWGDGSQTLRDFGEFSYQLPALFGVYGVSLWLQDEKLHEFSKAVISAYGISALATVTLKGITDTSRPTNQFEDGHYGFPSFHASSTFCIAAVVDEYYGWPVGVPCYVLAGLVGWSRIDQREHDLSDVFFGSVLGFVIGKSVALAHLERYGDYRIYPYYNPVIRGVGFTCSTTF